MGQKVTLGGERLGAGKKMKVELENFGRSTHDLGYIWRSTMAPGTLVPYMNILGLPGDKFDIELNTDVKTLPTVGPLFGSFKQQLDVFMCPLRLYQGLLHNNKLGIGMDMSKVKLPLIEIQSKNLKFGTNEPLEFQQINQSSLLAYLGIRGVGHNPNSDKTTRKYNAIPYLAYWDIYKNYYSNKMEEIGAVINTPTTYAEWISIEQTGGDPDPWNYTKEEFQTAAPVSFFPQNTHGNVIYKITAPKDTMNNGANIRFKRDDNQQWVILSDVAEIIGTTINGDNDVLSFYFMTNGMDVAEIDYYTAIPIEGEIKVKTFQLNNIDEMRENILSQTKNTGAFIINKENTTPEPYRLPLITTKSGFPNARNSQEGLGIKTYQSDLFNNWLNTEWIDGENGINEITAISTAGDKFTLDTFNLSKKVYDMLNRIAVSGGSYDDWVQAVYDTEPWMRTESPVYMGGLSKEVVFNEVISTAAAGDENPLGTLAGRGSLAKKHKGGYITIKCNEPCVIIGIVSLTPRVDYSQGNDWTVNLKTMDDFHKPSLDGIGFQELVTEQMAFWDTINQDNNQQIFHSAGKQPAWINYMTAVNRTYGNFADPRKEMFMTLNRRYEAGEDKRIKDLTTYIDPVKYNYMFANTALDAQNFWVQIAVDITARRKMSAKIMPNL